MCDLQAFHLLRDFSCLVMCRRKLFCQERSSFLVETSWLANHLEDADVRIVDMRGYVRTVEKDGIQEAQYEGARSEYEQSHIPGAVYIDWTRDIVDLDDTIKAQIATSQQ